MGDDEKASGSAAINTGLQAPILNLQPPTDLNVSDKHRAENWSVFKQRWENYAIITQLSKQPEDYQVALFLYSIGTEAVKTFNTFDLTEGDKKSLKSIIEAFDKFAIGEKNETYERYKFNSRNQQENESISAYVTEIRFLAKTCNFCACLHDTLIRDRIVLGIKDHDTRKRLLQKKKLTLTQCIDMCLANEATKSQLKALDKQDPELMVHKLQQTQRSNSQQREYRHKAGRDNDRESTGKPQQCRYCGRSHKSGRKHCPAWGKFCSKCGIKNHFSEVCHQKAKNAAQTHAVCDDESDVDSDLDYMGCVTVKEEINEVTGSQTTEPIYAEMIVNGNPIKFHVDCGASVSVLPSKFLKNETLKPTKKKLVMWNKTELKPKGTAEVTIYNPKTDRKHVIDFVVVDEHLMPLLGSYAIQHMEIIEVKRENFKSVSSVNQEPSTKAILGDKADIIARYKDVFSGELGTLAGQQRLTVDPDATPSVSPSRRVPLAMKPKLQAELDRLTDLGVIAPVDEPTDWVSNIVVATKSSGDLRVCIDPKELNKALKRERYPIPVIDDVLPELANAKLFTKLDAKNGYWHVVLDEESSKLTTFDTPFGRYLWKRLPFGLSVSSEIFQKRLNQALDKLDGLLSVHDDMVIYGVGDTDEAAREDHDRKLTAFLERCKERGIKLNKAKMQLRRTEITYLGHVVTNQGLKADPEKVEAIVNMPAPDDIKAVRRLCGFVNYLARFLPHLSDVLEPIRQLTRQDVEWQWNNTHDKAFETIKQMISSTPVLKYYDAEEELTVQCDASDKGIGAALLQNGQPLAFASRALTDTETRYAPIEKEMLAVVFALNKFNQYVYGRPVTVNSDHKPLEAIAQKPLRNAPKRLQGMLLKIQKYDIKIVYKPGTKMYLADTLSRAYISGSPSPCEEFEHVNAAKFVLMTDRTKERIKESTARDEVLQQLTEAILKGWPENAAGVPATLMPYYGFRDELAVHDGLVYRGERLVIPKDLKPMMREAIHSSHIGVNGCLRRARESMYWPSMNADIRNYIAQCETCRSFENRQAKETLRSHSPTDRPWEKVSADLFTLNGKDYLVVCDYFSNFIEVNYLENTKSSTVIRKLKGHFARYGIPDCVVTDNGPQFTSDNFKEFAEKWDFDIQTSSPGHQQANGLAESAVKTTKKLFRKAKLNGQDPFLALLAHRNTPSELMGTSPAQRFFGRRTKTLLPVTTGLLRPQGIDPESTKERRKISQAKQAHYYNKHAKDLDALEEGDIVRMRPFQLNKKTWDKALVKRKLDDRSYEVEANDTSYRRDRVDLRRTQEGPSDEEPAAASETHDVPLAPAPADTAVITPPVTPVPPATTVLSARPQRVRREPAYLKDFVRF